MKNKNLCDAMKANLTRKVYSLHKSYNNNHRNSNQQFNDVLKTL